MKTLQFRYSANNFEQQTGGVNMYVAVSEFLRDYCANVRETATEIERARMLDFQKKFLAIGESLISTLS